MAGRWKVLVGVAIVAMIAGWMTMRHVGRDDTDVDAIDRELTELADALRADENVDAVALLPPMPIVTVPQSMTYRRFSQFWGPVLAARERALRQRK